MTMPDDLHSIISSLVDRWCEKRSLGSLRIVLPHWPMPNGFTDEAMNLLAAFRHLRAMCRDELTQDEFEKVNEVIGILSRAVFKDESPKNMDREVDKLITAIFGKISN